MKRLTLAVQLAFVSLVWLTGLPTAAEAKSIVLVIPVDISNLPPDAHTARLACRLFSNTEREMGSEAALIPLVDGGYSGNVRLRFVPGGYPRNANPIPDAASYRCSLVFNWTCTSSTGGDGRCVFRPWDPDQIDGPAGSLFRRAEGQPARFRLEGTFDPETATELPRRMR